MLGASFLVAGALDDAANGIGFKSFCADRLRTKSNKVRGERRGLDAPPDSFELAELVRVRKNVNERFSLGEPVALTIGDMLIFLIELDSFVDLLFGSFF